MSHAHVGMTLIDIHESYVSHWLTADRPLIGPLLTSPKYRNTALRRSVPGARCVRILQASEAPRWVRVKLGGSIGRYLVFVDEVGFTPTPSPAPMSA